jgi:hypothetical protein
MNLPLTRSVRAVVLPVIGLCAAVPAQTIKACEEKGDFKACSGVDSDSGELVFSDGSRVGVYKDRLFFHDTGLTDFFDKQEHPDNEREAAAYCLALPGSFFTRFGKVPENWRMTTSTAYWECLMAQRLDFANTVALAKRHKDLLSLRDNMRYMGATASYLAEHFGDARFGVYTLSQREEAYKALHKQKWN